MTSERSIEILLAGRRRLRAWWQGPGRVPDLVFFVLFCLYAQMIPPTLGTLPYNPDEGVYIQTALDLKTGKIPVVDFLIHQPPLYPYLLQFFLPETLAGFHGSLLPARMPSFVAHLATVLLLWLWLRRRDPLVAASGALLYMLPLLHYFSLLAMPYAFMNLAVVAAFILFQRATPVSRAASALLLWIAWLIRPLAASFMVAAGAWTVAEFAFHPCRRKPATVFALMGIAGGILSWTWLQIVTHGQFPQILEAQWMLRSSTSYLAIWTALIYGSKIFDNPAGWTLVEHAKVWLLWSSYRFFPVGLLLLLLNAVPSLRRLPIGDLPNVRRQAALWFVSAFVFNMGLWGGPIWDHYQLLYMLPWALAAMAPTAHLYNWHRHGRRIVHPGRWGWITLFLFMLLAPALPPHHHDPDSEQLYARMHQLAGKPTPLFTLDPVVNIVSARPAGCIENWFAYARVNGLDRMPGRPLQNLVITDDEILTCLRTHPEIEIAISPWAQYAMTDRLRTSLGTFRDRLYCLLKPEHPEACLAKPGRRF